MATPSPSPFARSLLFGYVGMFLYESDAPLAERRAAALSLDSTLLAELLGSEAIRELLDPEVLAEVEASLQRLAPDRHARDAEGAADLLRFLGDLTTDGGGGARGAPRSGWPSWRRRGGSIRVRIGGEERWLPIEDAGRVRDALGAALPVGVPETFTEPVADPLGDLLLRYARTHGPFPAAECAARFGLGRRGGGRGARPAGRGRAAGPRRAAPARPAPAGRPGRDGIEYCDAEVLRRLRRASLARLRAEVEPVEQRALGRFLPAWQGVQTAAGGRAARPDAPGARRRGRAGRGGAAGRGAAAGQRAGVADPARPAARLHPGAARRADRGGRGHLDRVRPAGRHRRLARAGPGRRRRPAAARAGAGRGRDPAAPGAARRAGPARPRRRSRSAAGRCSSASSPTGPAAR